MPAAVAAVAIRRTDHTVGELRQIAARTHEGHAARRMLSLAHVLDGRSRGEAARLCGMDSKRFATACIATMPTVWSGFLIDRIAGDPPRLTGEQQAEVACWVR